MKTPTIRAVGYTRVSTAEQAGSGLGLQAQRGAIASECQRRGLILQEVFEDAGASGKSLRKRPQLAAALALLESDQADVIVVSKLDRLSRSVIDFANLLERSHKKGWALIALDLGVDTTTPSGKLIANVMVSVAEWERETIGLRTKEALAVKRRQGVRLGRPSRLPSAVRDGIAMARAGGSTLQAIADDLNARSIPTGQGGRLWHPSSVRAVLARPT